MSFFTDITDSADEVSGDVTTSFDKLNGAIDEIEKDVVQSLKSVMRAVLGVERKINKFWKAVMPLVRRLRAHTRTLSLQYRLHVRVFSSVIGDL